MESRKHFKKIFLSVSRKIICSTYSSNQMKNQNQSRLFAACFLTLYWQFSSFCFVFSLVFRLATSIDLVLIFILQEWTFLSLLRWQWSLAHARWEWVTWRGRRKRRHPHASSYRFTKTCRTEGVISNLPTLLVHCCVKFSDFFTSS